MCLIISKKLKLLTLEHLYLVSKLRILLFLGLIWYLCTLESIQDLNFRQIIFVYIMFCSSQFSFLVFGHFWQRSYKNTKILGNLCLHFARQDGQDGKNRKGNHATKVTKIPKTKRRKYGMNETLVPFILKKSVLNLIFFWKCLFRN